MEAVRNKRCFQYGFYLILALIGFSQVAESAQILSQAQIFAQISSSDRLLNIRKAISAFTDFQALYPAGAVESYLGSITKGTFLIPNAFAVQTFLKTYKQQGKNVSKITGNLLKYLTIPIVQKQSDFQNFLANTVIYPYPTVFGAPVYGEEIFSGIYFLGDPNFLPGNAYVASPNLFVDSFLSIQGVDNVLLPPNDLLNRTISAFPPPFQPSACGSIRPGYIYEKNYYYPGYNLYTIFFPTVTSIPKCVNNCTGNPKCVGFTVHNNTCAFKSKLGTRTYIANGDTFSKCTPPPGAPTKPPPPPKSPPPPPAKSPPPPKNGPTISLPWFLGATSNQTTATVVVGTTVSWVWGDKLNHSVQDLNMTRNLFQGPGGGLNTVPGPFQYRHTFTQPGTYFYDDAAYSLLLQGVIFVVPVGTPSPPPPPPPKSGPSPPFAPFPPFPAPKTTASPPPPASGSCGAVQRGFKYEANANYPNNNLYWIPLSGGSTVSTCVANCTKTAECAGFSVQSGYCKLKRKLGFPQALSGVNSYTKCANSCGEVVAGYVYETKTNYPNNNMYSLKLSGSIPVRTCVNNCTGNPNCVGFTVYQGYCKMKGTIGNRKSLADADSYTKCSAGIPRSPPAPSTCGDKVAGYVYEANRNYPNSNLYWIPSSLGINSCLTNCTKTSTCAGFSVQSGYCKLKRRLGYGQALAGVNSYAKCN